MEDQMYLLSSYQGTGFKLHHIPDKSDFLIILCELHYVDLTYQFERIYTVGTPFG